MGQGEKSNWVSINLERTLAFNYQEEIPRGMLHPDNPRRNAREYETGPRIWGNSGTLVVGGYSPWWSPFARKGQTLADSEDEVAVFRILHNRLRNSDEYDEAFDCACSLREVKDAKKLRTIKVVRDKYLALGSDESTLIDITKNTVVKNEIAEPREIDGRLVIVLRTGDAAYLTDVKKDAEKRDSETSEKSQKQLDNICRDYLRQLKIAVLRQEKNGPDYTLDEWDRLMVRKKLGSPLHDKLLSEDGCEVELALDTSGLFVAIRDPEDPFKQATFKVEELGGTLWGEALNLENAVQDPNSEWWSEVNDKDGCKWIKMRPTDGDKTTWRLSISKEDGRLTLKRAEHRESRERSKEKGDVSALPKNGIERRLSNDEGKERIVLPHGVYWYPYDSSGEQMTEKSLGPTSVQKRTLKLTLGEGAAHVEVSGMKPGETWRATLTDGNVERLQEECEWEKPNSQAANVLHSSKKYDLRTEAGNMTLHESKERSSGKGISLGI